MRNTSITLGLLIFLFGCQTDKVIDPPPRGTALLTQEDLELVLDRTLSLTHDNAMYRTMIIKSDNTLGGDWSGLPLDGHYIMRDGLYCRTITEGPNHSKAEGEHCHQLFLYGDRLTFVRDSGKGDFYVMTVHAS